jgi:ribosome maturation factor RimP
MGELMEQFRPQMDEVAQRHGCYIVAVETARMGKQTILRILADSPHGITIEQCVQINQELQVLLPEDILPGNYSLEVASPGAERVLTTDLDLQRAIGRYVKLTFLDAFEKQMVIEGTLQAVNEEYYHIFTTELKEIPRRSVATIRLAIKM